ncbi:MAG: hypothetical protein Q7U02_15080, partial [Desulfosalsimonadaceae bacterium]|nr:hypothetical protein [Desulfosalsimonadaceae bacterium]
FHQPVTLYNKDTPMTETLSPEVVLADAQIDEAVLFINERVASYVFNGSIEIGQYVFERFFNNDLALAGSKNRYKPVSYRRLCAHPDLCVSSSTLMDMVKTAAQEHFLYDGGIPAQGIIYSLKVLLTRLENNDQKLELARACIDEHLVVAELKQRIREIHDQSSGVSDNPAIAMKNHLTRVERWIRRVAAPAGMTSRSVVGGLAPADREALLNSAGGILEDMSVITNAIQQMVSILIEIQAAPEIEGPGSEAA